MHAILVLPLSVLGMTGFQRVPPALTGSLGHAHEMLFGYALAVIAGYLLGSLPPGRLLALLGLWIAARTSFLLLPRNPAAVAFNSAFVVMLVMEVAPKYLRAAKKARNQSFVFMIAGIALAAIAQEIARYAAAGGAQHLAYAEAVLLFALLMLFMGGRIIAPAAAGQFYRQGQYLGPRVQPRLEAGLIASVVVALILAVIPWGRVPAGIAIAAAGVMALVRMLRWRLWAARARPDLWCLGVGYAWIAVGLLLFARAWLAGGAVTTALHALTVGALGTLTLNVMARVAVTRARLDPARVRAPVIGTVLIAAATCARLAAAHVAGGDSLLLTAAACWSGAYALLLALLVHVRRS